MRSETSRLEILLVDDCLEGVAKVYSLKHIHFQHRYWMFVKVKIVGKNKILRKRIKRLVCRTFILVFFYCRNSERLVMKVTTTATTFQCIGYCRS